MRLIAYKRFTKRINSTKRPSYENDENDVLWVFLKKDTSLLNPVFELQIDKTVDEPFNYTYCQFHNRYYYVTDIVVRSNDIYELHCKHDALASYRWYIERLTAYIEYAADTTQYNKWIPDKRITMTSETTKSSNSHNIFGATAGSYILSVAGNNASARFGFTNFWVLTTAQLTSLSNWLYTEDMLTTDYWKKIFDSPYKAIIECHWVPWNVSGTTGYISIGDKVSSISGEGIGYPSYGLSLENFDIAIPSVYNDWRDFDPYSTLLLYLPFVGTTTIDRAKLKGVTNLHFTVLKDAISGEIFYFISGGEYKQIASAHVAVNIPIGQTTDNRLGGLGKSIAGAVSLVGGAAALMGGPATTAGYVTATSAVAGGITGVFSGAMTYFSTESGGSGSVNGLASGVGTSATASSYGSASVSLTQIAHHFSIVPTSIKDIEGIPIYKPLLISNLKHGYIKCAGASINVEGFESDKSAINTALNNGFFYE